MLNLPELTVLQSIRDTGPVTSRNTSKGALVQEVYQVFRPEPGRTLEVEAVRTSILEQNIIHKTSYATRKKVWDAIKHRYLAIAPDWVGPALSNASQHGLQSPEFLSLAYLYYALRDRLTYEFVTGPIRERWQQQVTSLNRGDFLTMLDNLADLEPQIKKWRETTRHPRRLHRPGKRLRPGY
jgi:hypothetical protein